MQQLIYRNCDVYFVGPNNEFNLLISVYTRKL